MQWRRPQISTESSQLALVDNHVDNHVGSHMDERETWPDVLHLIQSYAHVCVQHYPEEGYDPTRTSDLEHIRDT